MAVIFTSHVKEALAAEQAARNKALEMIGGKAESNAKKLCPVDTEENGGYFFASQSYTGVYANGVCMHFLILGGAYSPVILFGRVHY